MTVRLGERRGSTSEIATAVARTGAVAADGGRLLLSVSEAAKRLGISRGRLYELVNRGEIDSVSIGRRRLVSRDALAKFIEANTTTGYRPHS